MRVAVFWFRRDLRLEDNVGLNKALESGLPVVPIFIFDENILNELPNDDPRVNFIYDELKNINEQLKNHQTRLHIFMGNPLDVWVQILKEYEVAQVFSNKDYEPYALKRDAKVEELVQSQGSAFKQYKDQVIFEESEVVKDDGEPYIVYTPYMKKWKALFAGIIESEPVKFNHFSPSDKQFPSKSRLGIKPSKIKVEPYDQSILDKYAKNRNIPSIDTSRISPHLRFGTVSIRNIFSKIYPKYEKYANELIWREFFIQILYHYPKSHKENFRSKYDQIQWRNNEEEFEKWCNGETGYPLVDAGMRELNETGYMHGRVRMVTASFLIKHLLIDWRWGEAYFAQKLLDFELSSNVGNWQWVAGTGVDAAPYFRIFNPAEQLKKFDPDLKYVRKWVKDFDEITYPKEIVEHKFARDRCLKAFKEGLAVNT